MTLEESDLDRQGCLSFSLSPFLCGQEERAGVDKRFVGKNQTFVRAKREKQEREASFKAEGVK